MSYQFSQPSSGNFFKPADRVNHLIIVVHVTEIGERYDSLAGRDKPYAIADIVDLDAQPPALEQGVTLSHPGIVNKVTNAHRTGEMVLGRIGQVPTEKGNPAWVLGPYAQGQDDARASAWLTANPINQFGQPAAPAPTPAPAPAPAPAPIQQATAPYTTPAGPNHPVMQAYNAAQQQPQAPAAPVQQAGNPWPQAAPQASVQQPVAQIDPNNVPPEIAALLAQVQQPTQ